MAVLLALAQFLEAETLGVPSPVPAGMMSATARSPQAVGLLLIANGYQSWKLPALLGLGNGVAILRHDGSVRHGAPAVDTGIEPDELLVFPPPDRANAATRQEWQRLANAEARDYVLISGTDAFGRRAAGFYGVMPATVAINEPATTVQWLIAGLNARVATAQAATRLDVAAPVRDVVLVAHGSYGGRLQLSTDDSVTLDYARLKQQLGSPAGDAWRLDAAAFDPRPVVAGGRAPARVVIVGCNIGRADGFAAALRRLLNVDELAAMRHFVGVWPGPDGKTFTLFVMLDLRVARPQRLANAASVIAALNGAGLQDLDGRPVALGAADLTLADGLLHRKALPDGRPAPREPGFDERVEHVDAGAVATYDVPLVGAAGFGNAPLGPRYRYVKQRLLAAPRRLGGDPGSDAGRLAAALADLKSMDLHDAAFPIWARWSEPDEARFAATWDWQFKAVRGGFTYQPIRHEYRLLFPATWRRPGDGHRVLVAQVAISRQGLGPDMRMTELGQLAADGFPQPGSAVYDRLFSTVKR